MDGWKLTDPLAWAQETFGAAELGDPRRTRRLVRVAAQMAADPQGSLPREMGGDWAALKAAYRLVRADGVTHEAISRPVWQQTRQQMEQEPGVVLLVHDDTQVDYGYRPAIGGLGPIGNGTHLGFFVHTVPELDHLLDRATSGPAQAQGSIEVPSEHERRARTAQVQLSWAGMQLLPPKQGPYAGSEPLPLWVVRVWEPEPPSKQEAQREWVP